MNETRKELHRRAAIANAAGNVLAAAAGACFLLMLAYLNGAGWCAGSVLSLIGAVVFGCGCADALLSAAGYEIRAEKEFPEREGTE